MVQAVNLLKSKGARDIYMSFVHPLLSLNASERLAALPIKQFITTDTLPITKENLAPFGSSENIKCI